jgi:hypothetical protein
MFAGLEAKMINQSSEETKSGSPYYKYAQKPLVFDPGVQLPEYGERLWG